MLALFILLAVLLRTCVAFDFGGGPLPGVGGDVLRGRTSCCRDGWLSYGGSCYWFARDYDERRSFVQARAACDDMAAALFVPYDKEEWNAVVRHSPITQWAWIGLSLSEHSGKAGPQWVHRGGRQNAMSYQSLPWLVKSPGHGAAPSVECVAYYNPLGNVGSYVNYYGCRMLHYYICKRPIYLK